MFDYVRILSYSNVRGLQTSAVSAVATSPGGRVMDVWPEGG